MPIFTSLLTTGAVVERMNQTGLAIDDADLIEVGRSILSAGFEGIELTLELIELFPGTFGPALLDFCREAAGQGKVLTAHLPFISLPTLTHQAEVREAAVANILSAYRRVEDLPIRQFVLHLDEGLLSKITSREISNRETRRLLIERLREQGRRSLETLLKTIPPEKVLIENLFEPQPEIVLALAEEFDLDTCFDLGHQLMNGESISDYFQRWGARVGQIHLHDVIEEPSAGGKPKRRDHQALGRGIVKLDELVTLLCAHGKLDVPIVLEMPLEPARESLPMWRRAIGGGG